MYALQRTTQKCHILKVSRNIIQYKERASSSIVHVCASMWVSVSIKPSRGQCYPLHYTTKSGTFLNASIYCTTIWFRRVVQWRGSGITDVLQSSGVSYYRLQILFLFYVQDLMGWAGNLREKEGETKKQIGGQSWEVFSSWNLIKHWYLN